MKMPNRFSSYSETKSFLLNVTTTPQKVVKEDKNLLKQVFPELDLMKYSLFYTQKRIKQIKIVFRYFYDNRIDFLLEKKKKNRTEKLLNETNKDYLKNIIYTSEKSQKSANSFRKKLYDIIETEEAKKNHSNSQSPDHYASVKTKPKLKLDEVYDILRKKKRK